MRIWSSATRNWVVLVAGAAVAAEVRASLALMAEIGLWRGEGAEVLIRMREWCRGGNVAVFANIDHKSNTQQTIKFQGVAE